MCIGEVNMFFLLVVINLVSAQPEPLRLDLFRSASYGNEAVEERISQTDIHGQNNNLNGKPGQGYYITVNLGTPPQSLNVLVDTGSSNFAVAAADNQDISKYFQSARSSTFQEKGTSVFVPYTQGNWQGRLGNDVVTVQSLPNLTVRVDVVGIDSSEKFFINGSNWQGILGMAYAAIARPDESVEPFFDSFVSQTGLSDVFSIQLCGSLTPSAPPDQIQMGGSMILGGVDNRLYSGPVLYSPVYKDWYYEVIIADVLVKETSLNMDCKEYNFDKTIVDSGTTNLRLPTKVYNSLITQLQLLTTLPDSPPVEFWTGVDILCWPRQSSPLDMFPDVKLALLMADNSSFHLVISPQQYLRSVGDHISQFSKPNQDCFKFAIAPSTTGTVIGAVIMEGYYVIFDRENKRIGWAETVCSNTRNPSLRKSLVQGPFYINVSMERCVYVKPETDQTTLTTVAYAMAAVCALCVLPVLLALVQWQVNRWRHPTVDGDGLIQHEVSS